MQNAIIIEVNEQNVHQALSQSNSMPVLFYFWSEVDLENQSLTAILTKIAAEYAGQFTLATLNCDAHPMLAGQFGLTILPTLYLFKNGQPVDGLQGPQTEQKVKQLLQRVLPDQYEMQLNDAKVLMEKGEYNQAIVLLKKIYPSLLNENGTNRTDIGFLLTNALLKLKKIEEAKDILSTIPKKEQHAEYQALCDHIELLAQAANSPEIQQLKKQLDKKPEDIALIVQFAQALHQVGRNEEALMVLFNALEKDINVAGGKIKKTFMDLLNNLGTGNALVGTYRRKLYSLLY